MATFRWSEFRHEKAMRSNLGHSCKALHMLAVDFHDLIREHCPRCRDGVGSCLVERLSAVVQDEAGGSFDEAQ